MNDWSASRATSCPPALRPARLTTRHGIDRMPFDQRTEVRLTVPIGAARHDRSARQSSCGLTPAGGMSTGGYSPSVPGFPLTDS